MWHHGQIGGELEVGVLLRLRLYSYRGIDMNCAYRARDRRVVPNGREARGALEVRGCEARRGSRADLGLEYFNADARRATGVQSPESRTGRPDTRGESERNCRSEPRSGCMGVRGRPI